MICSIVGAALTFWRFAHSRKQDAIDVAVWRKEIENRVANAEGFSKRIDTEYKAADDEHKLAHASIMEEVRKGFTSVTGALNALTERIVRVETSLEAHRRECEGRRAK